MHSSGMILATSIMHGIFKYESMYSSLVSHQKLYASFKENAWES